ncbi:hypothetical protein A3C23_00370 [Candidatus Roizmanbacteria bacterium RIFCSPHIGHO2_02_FULL_37_13b]|uniref:Ribonuclease VapC n=1 Tax=Candidatus Roizmanbacteria bacterium RIFCSPLOWO2_02_FULL_36_11 TaxID=1802071 RepID=A0A1F7JBG7_9BACT|nr:MAG: hypothetical protein A3C23_00370 [Candidatus Roizmanbacteria bacterium RIFCSPHIGHO2_02_FULL_37_13b]OGK52957.1 MAG: hypothetical protein A3H78_02480 [Candidatus Roizmanbacteria bacterium RIFCSPLOWO2_02_FULL_36_11]
MALNFALPDTNVLILGLAKKEPSASFLRTLIENNTLVLSSIVVAEFLVGVTDEEEKIFQLLLQRFKVLPVDSAVSQIAAYYRKKYLGMGRKLALPDCLIAATCKVYQATLVTLNKRDYPMNDIQIINP